MKKIFSKILALSMVASIIASGTAFAETYDMDVYNIENANSMETTGQYDEYGKEIIEFYSDEDITLALNEDIYWINLYMYEVDGFYSYDLYTYDGYFNVDADVTLVETEETLSLDEYYMAVDAGEIDFNADAYINAGGTITMNGADGADAKFILEVLYDDGYSWDTIYCEISTVSQEVEIVTGTAEAATATVMFEGEETVFEAYEINGNNYFKLRDLASIVSGTEKQFEVTWDEALQAIDLVSGESYTEVGGELEPGDNLDKDYKTTTASIYKDGDLVKFEAYEINGNNYFKLRDVCQSFDIGVTWDDATQTIGIDTSISYEE